MKFALVNRLKQLPNPQTHGECTCCGTKVISKCGDRKLWHWAHYSKRNCDDWWENETQWHRDWKGNFPVDWQEVIHQDENGEKHIADVKTSQGWALEFQHSFLKSEERKSRNEFYKKIVWVVDGLRRSRDKEQFFKLLNELNPVWQNPHVCKINLDECALLRDWSGNPGPVLFDFGDDVLWCLVSVKQNTWGYVVAFLRHAFIALHNNSTSETSSFENYINQLNEIASLLEQKYMQDKEPKNRNFIFDRRHAGTRRWRL